MATFPSLKRTLGHKATETEPSAKQPLSDTQYNDGLNVLGQGSEWTTYQDFIIPQLSQLFTRLLDSRTHIAVLEIGPGPKSVLAYLPCHLRQRISRYTAYEPCGLLATKVEEWLCSVPETESPLPCLENPPEIYRAPFVLNGHKASDNDAGTHEDNEKFDLVLFCQSMYGMEPKERFIEQVLGMLVEQSKDGMVVVFHRGQIHFEGLVCHQMASFTTGAVSVANNDEVLDRITPFLAGFVMQDAEQDKAIRVEWRKVCRALSRRDKNYPNHLFFDSSTVMAVLTQSAIGLPNLTAQVPLLKGEKTVKNREARLHKPASIVRPTAVEHVQQCVRWALKHGASLTVLGGGHSSHCLWPNIVAVDMEAFDQVHILPTSYCRQDSRSESVSLVVAEAGSKTGGIVSKTMAAGLAVSLGSRPSVGAGLWLQGGIGHLARMHGLACDAIVGAVMVSVASGQVLCIGHVPSQHWPAGAVRPGNEADLLWAIKGAGTNFGIVVSVTFQAHAASTYSIRNWVVPLSDNLEAQSKLSDFDNLIARRLPRNFSADAYLYCDIGKLHFGVTVFESSMTSTAEMPNPTTMPVDVNAIMGLGSTCNSVDAVGLFESDMYMSGMHGGHGGGKTSSFKRCVFLKDIGALKVAEIFIAVIETCSSPLSYFHLLQGGGAVSDVAADATAFGCRDWDFACVINGVWPRDQDGTEVARAAVQWVYNVTSELLPLSSGVYGTDLGPDPRDAALAAKAFGINLPRLARLKHTMDPCNVLRYTCSLPKEPMEQKLIILVTGDSCAGKDFCADIWATVFTSSHKNLKVRVASISDVTKQEYAAASGANFSRLLGDRSYKEQHRPALTAFFQNQVRDRPQLPQEQFLALVHDTAGVDVLLITGMRDEAPVAELSHLVSYSRLLDVRVKASKDVQHARGGSKGGADNENITNGKTEVTPVEYRPSLIFGNSVTGIEAPKKFAEDYLLPFFHEDLQRLANMVQPVPDFPRPGIEFRHVLNISQRPGGLDLCSALMQTHLTGDWAEVDAVVCCEAGGFIQASALASRVDIPLALIREAGKLPPPTYSVPKPTSHISSTADHAKEKRIEMGRDLIPKGGSVVVVDDVFATGNTLCAVLQLLIKAGADVEKISVMVVAEFPVHRGREVLRQHGFGRVNVQSLLVFGGA